MSKTNENLMSAFAGESQASRKYTIFAQVAEKEGHMGAARMFRAAAEAETIHATMELKLAGKVGDTAANLKAAVEGETYEYTTMYPEFIKEAEAEGNKDAVAVFNKAKEAEVVHAELYKALESNINDDSHYYLCPLCGYIHRGSRPDTCPICKAKGSTFKEF